MIMGLPKEKEDVCRDEVNNALVEMEQNIHKAPIGAKELMLMKWILAATSKPLLEIY